MSAKIPSESTLKARRRRKPIFIDEPIQWHRRNTDLDRCPWCGLRGLVSRGSQRRICTNESCQSAFENKLRTNEWLKAKMSGLLSLQYRKPYYAPMQHGGKYSLEEAQIRSKLGRGMMVVRHTLRFRGDLDRIYWHRIGHLPETKDGVRICEGGSDLHRWIMDLRCKEVWTPDEPLCAMEVLARAANDEPMFCTITP